MAEAVRERRLLVDFENVQKIDLSTLPDDFRVTVFVGDAQPSLPFSLVQGAQPFGENLEWIRVEGKGRNALDFHLSYYLGCLLTVCPRTEVVILSKDSGFDPLMRHLKKTGVCCRRIGSLLDLEGRSEAVDEINYIRVVKHLTKIATDTRPRRRSTLANYISGIFQRKLPAREVQEIISQLMAEGKVTETNQKLTYELSGLPGDRKMSIK